MHQGEGFEEFALQFGIVAAHGVGQFHAEGLDAGGFVEAEHVVEAEVEEVGADVVGGYALAVDEVEHQAAEGGSGGGDGEVDELRLRKGGNFGGGFVGESPGGIAGHARVVVEQEVEQLGGGDVGGHTACVGYTQRAAEVAGECGMGIVVVGLHNVGFVFCGIVSGWWRR